MAGWFARHRLGRVMAATVGGRLARALPTRSIRPCRGCCHRIGRGRLCSPALRWVWWPGLRLRISGDDHRRPTVCSNPSTRPMLRDAPIPPPPTCSSILPSLRTRLLWWRPRRALPAWSGSSRGVKPNLAPRRGGTGARGCCRGMRMRASLDPTCKSHRSPHHGLFFLS